MDPFLQYLCSLTSENSNANTASSCVHRCYGSPLAHFRIVNLSRVQTYTQGDRGSHTVVCFGNSNLIVVRLYAERERRRQEENLQSRVARTLGRLGLSANPDSTCSAIGAPVDSLKMLQLKQKRAVIDDRRRIWQRSHCNVFKFGKLISWWKRFSNPALVSSRLLSLAKMIPEFRSQQNDLTSFFLWIYLDWRQQAKTGQLLYSVRD